MSPEFGVRIDLKILTRDLLSRMERDLGALLEWVAVERYNTKHPHVHVALRAMGADGKPFQLGRDYIEKDIRASAEDLCTRQIGHRTELDAAFALPEGGESASLCILGSHRRTGVPRKQKAPVS